MSYAVSGPVQLFLAYCGLPHETLAYNAVRPLSCAPLAMRDRESSRYERSPPSN